MPDDKFRDYNHNADIPSGINKEVIRVVSPFHGSIKSNTTEQRKTNNLNLEMKDTESRFSSNGIRGLIMLVKTPAMRKITILFFIIWMLQGIVYYGIPLNASNFAK